jgi:hypothetical protein
VIEHDTEVNPSAGTDSSQDFQADYREEQGCDEEYPPESGSHLHQPGKYQYYPTHNLI